MTTSLHTMLQRFRLEFCDHQIASETPHKIVFRTLKSGHLAVCFLDAGNALLMWGDLGTACWAYTSPDSSLRAKIAWIGFGGPDYAAEKWQIGMSLAPHQWDASRACPDLVDDLVDRDVDDDDRLTLTSVVDAFRAAKREDEQDFHEALTDAGFDSDDAVSIGRVYKPRVLSSYAAAKACAQLLATLPEPQAEPEPLIMLPGNSGLREVELRPGRAVSINKQWIPSDCHSSVPVLVVQPKAGDEPEPAPADTPSVGEGGAS